jgi:hypothetical protein
MTHYSHAKTDDFEHNFFQPCWNWRFWLQHILAMLGTCDFEHNTFHACWNWQFWPWHVPAMLKLTILPMTQSSHAETDDFDHNTFQTCCNWRFLHELRYKCTFGGCWNFLVAVLFLVRLYKSFCCRSGSGSVFKLVLQQENRRKINDWLQSVLKTCSATGKQENGRKITWPEYARPPGQVRT